MVKQYHHITTTITTMSFDRSKITLIDQKITLSFMKIVQKNSCKFFFRKKQQD